MPAMAHGGRGMSLASGKYWITPTRKAEMATNLGKAFTVKGGKIAKKPPRMVGKSRKQLEARAKRDEAKWRKAK